MVINNHFQSGNLLQVTMEASIAQTPTKHLPSHVLYLMIVIIFGTLTHISHHKLVSPRFCHVKCKNILGTYRALQGVRVEILMNPWNIDGYWSSCQETNQTH